MRHLYTIVACLFFCAFTLTTNSQNQNIDVLGNAISIANGDLTPQVADNTDFGSVTVGFGPLTNTFEIENTHSGGNPSNNVLTITSISLSGANAADFTINSTITTIPRSNSETFTIDFNPSAAGVRTALVTIINNSSDLTEQTYTYQIQGTGLAPTPDIDVVDDTNDAIDDGGGNSPTTLNSTSFGSTDTLNPISYTYTIENNGTGTLNISSVTSSNPDFAITVSPSATVAVGATTTFTVTFTPTSAGSISGIITINNDAASPKDVYTFNVQGTGTLPPPVYTAYFHTFDDSAEGWTAVTSTNDSWVRTNAFTTTDEMGEGYFWRNSAYNTYPANTNIVVESPVYDFTGLENIKFSIDVKYNTQNGVDGMRILYSVAGGAFVTLGASGSGTNWYEDAVTALGTDGWNDDGHSATPSFSPHSQFGRSSMTLSDATFANQSNVRFRVQFSSDASTGLEGVAFDNVLIEADPSTALNASTIAPANVTTDLRLWLKGNTGISATDGDNLLLWEDQAYDTTLDKEDAFTVTDLAPIYRDNATRNMNYNPALDFDHTDQAYMNGKGGYFSQDYFVVFRSDDNVENNTGGFTPGRQFAIGGRFSDDAYHEDPTGLGMGSSTSRYPNEILAHNISSFPNSSGAPPNDESYGRAYSTTTDTFSNHPLIVNVKSNASRTQTEIYKNGKKIDNITGVAGNGSDLNFNEFNNLQYLIGMGRSGIAGRTTSQMNGLIAEVISYSSPNSAINQQKIESYLAIKYGATLQAPASALLDHRLNDTDYIDSQGTVIWDTSESDAFSNFYNYDVAGIGRDDASLLDQRQSRSQNDEADATGPTSGFLTIALEDTYDTNNINVANTTTLLDREFLVWGNNNASLDAAPVSITVDMSANVTGLSTPVSFESMSRVWKVKETGPTVLGVPADVGTVEVSIPKSVVRTATPPDGRYLMFISQNGQFDPTADYREMTEVNDSLYVKYDFDGIEYITFGWAPEETYSRSVYFDPAGQNYIDMEDNFDLASGDFTISAWIKRDASSANTSILSKRNVGYTEGYDLKINSSGYVEMSWMNGSLQSITSDVVIPVDEWHQVAIIYSSGTATMYIDGIEEKSAPLAAPLDTNSSFFIGAAAKIIPEAFFHGNIDEVRVWNKALSTDELHYIMNQELEDNASTIGQYFNSKSVVPSKNAAITLSYADLEGYYPMSTYTYTNTKDESGNQRTGSLKQLRTVDYQTAPLPYVSTQAGDWDTDTTWVNGDVQTMPGDVALADNTKTVDWNIVETTHDLTMDNSGLLDDGDGNYSRTVLAHVLDSGEVTVDGDVASETGFGYVVTHYLELNGKIDLEGESQLIQSTDSDLVVGLSGELERDQQGTSNRYHYNYWSAPIGITDAEVNEYSYAVADILKDRTFDVDFIINTYDGNPGTGGTAVQIADYWIWKFADNTDGDYSQWEHVRSTGNMLAGEGFTMKGSGDVTAYQNYTYLGKPNNSDIELSVSPYNDYLVGNPYASAIDARQFIIDNGAGLFYDDGSADPDATGNTPATNGTLYFWEHWGGGDHVLANYQGGYATYNLSGAVAAPRLDQGTSDPDVSSAGTPTKTPGHYIPVGQGFFVVGNEDGGTIQFNNGQRIFKKETVSSGVFMRTTQNEDDIATTDEEDTRKKVKIGFNSVGNLHRQLLLTFDENTTTGVDWGYDGTTYDYQTDDMFWLIEDNFYVIQASNQIEDATYPLALYTSVEGENTFTIDELVNIPDNLDVFLHDKEVDFYHNLKEGDYTIFLEAAYYDTRFEITFQLREQEQPDDEEPDTDVDVAEDLDPIDLGDKLDVRYANNIKKIVLMNPHNIDVNSIELINLLGQSVQTIEHISESGYSEYTVRDLSPGTYIIRLNTVSGSVSKKIIVN
ncbi:LamG-like jellyroll fold domain-containing protein [Winogradskyella sp. A3E31]|uniref:LamG-like jellyroll fold domain-containing protein n=1 Tax=Winogradskyella sp. A3E31 TaxID=3349637 RepID=UPI00398B1791